MGGMVRWVMVKSCPKQTTASHRGCFVWWLWLVENGTMERVLCDCYTNMATAQAAIKDM